MKIQVKVLVLCTLIVSIMSFGSFAYSAQDKKSPAEAKAELKERLVKSIKKMDNGDVIIVFPKFDLEKINAKDSISPLLKLFISYVDPDMDFANLDKSMKREIGKAKSGIPIVKIMAGISKGLSRNNMQLQKIGFSANNAILKLEEGVPLIAWVADTNVYKNELLPRSEKRANVKNMDDWKKELRKLELRKVERDKVFKDALIMGYNKKTDEFLLFDGKDKPVWATEKEIKKLLLEVYQLRY